MSIKHPPVAKTSVKFNGVFNYNDFFVFLYSLIKTEGYMITSDQHKQKMRDIGEKVDINWKFEKRIDDYTKFIIKVYILIMGMNDVIIKKNGKEVKMNKGDMLVRFEGSIETDWNNYWEKSPFLKKLRGFYEQYLFWKTLDSYGVEVYKQVYFFSGELKSFLELIKFK